MKKRKRDEENFQEKEPNKRLKISYPRKILRNSLEFSFVNQKKTWAKLNLKNNEQENKATFRKLVPLKNDLFKFSRIMEIGVSLLPGQICNIYAYEYFNNTRTFFIAPTLDSIKELILSGENFLHEYIYNLPIKFFMDIDNPIQEKHFKLEKSIILKKIEHIKKIYEKKLQKVFDESQIINEWIVKDASYSKKISYHLIANHSITYYCSIEKKKIKVPIYFKNCEHVNFLVRKIKKETSYNFIDDGIGNRKSLRMYFCGYKSNRSRIFRCNDNPMFDFEILKKSLLQLRSELVEKFYQVDFFGDKPILENNEEEIIIIPDSEMLKQINSNVVPQRGRRIKKRRLPNKYNSLGMEVVNELIRFLINKRIVRGVDFTHLSKHKNKISMYRIMKQIEAPFSLFIEIYFFNCLMQEYSHTKRAGRTIIVNGQDKKIGFMCGSPKKTKHNRTGFFMNFRETNDRVQKKVLKLLEKTKNE